MENREATEAQTFRTRDDQLLEETTVRRESRSTYLVSSLPMDAFEEGMFSSNVVIEQQLCKISCPVVQKLCYLIEPSLCPLPLKSTKICR